MPLHALQIRVHHEVNQLGKTDCWLPAKHAARFAGVPDECIHLRHAQERRVLHDMLAPVQADGSLDQAIVANRRAARERSRVLARAISADRPLLADEIEVGVSAFVDHAIGKMVTICRAIRVVRGQ